MTHDTVLAFYDELGFELIDFDGYNTLFIELLDDGSYATVSDDDGHIPESLNTNIVFNVYDDNDSFQWSVTLHDSHQLQELMISAESIDHLLCTLQNIRQENIEEFQ